MDIQRIHFIRGILGRNYQGEAIPTMQYSYDNASYLDPIFMEVPSNDQANLRALYEKLGGSRPAEAWFGTTVIIPHRSFWASWRSISRDEVRVIANTGPIAPQAA